MPATLNRLNPLLRKAKLEGWSTRIKTEADEAAILAGAEFDLARAEHVRTYFRQFLRHSKGEWAGKPFELAEWEWSDIIAPLFGWIWGEDYEDPRKRGCRRYQVAYIEVPKKNGKSCLGSGLCLYGTTGDAEPAAEVYCVAADKNQALIVFHEAENMVEASPDLASELQVISSRKIIQFPATRSFYQALSADVPTKEGLNIHFLVYDELHAQPSRKMWDTLRFGGAARRQPLLVAITTAGWDRTSICWEQHEYAQAILDGVVRDDPLFFPYIRAADPKDEWTDPRIWSKANPSLGLTLSIADMRAACAEAARTTAKRNAFLRYRLNIWTEQEERWIPMEAWREKCGLRGIEPPRHKDTKGDNGKKRPRLKNMKEGVETARQWRDRMMTELAGKPCFGGLDLGSTSDLTALALLFGSVNERVIVLPWFWVPERGLFEREITYAELYRHWIADGFITPTSGDTTDYNQVRADIRDIAEWFNIRELAVDRVFQGAQTCTDLMADGMNVIAYSQSFLHFAAPSKIFLELILNGKLAHGDNPVLTWMAANAVAAEDVAGNVKPMKPKKMSRLKIDGIIASIMALGRMMANPPPAPSVYETRGLRL